MADDVASFLAKVNGPAQQQAAAPSTINPQAVYEYLLSKGVNEVHAKGMLGNILGESQFNPTSVGDNGNAGGLFQHNGPRFDALKSTVPDWPSNWKGQADFALGEPDTQKYLAASYATPEDASKAFTVNWERPKNAMAKANARAANIPSVEAPQSPEVSGFLSKLNGTGTQAPTAQEGDQPLPQTPNQEAGQIGKTWTTQRPDATAEGALKELGLGDFTSHTVDKTVSALTGMVGNPFEQNPLLGPPGTTEPITQIANTLGIPLPSNPMQGAADWVNGAVKREPLINATGQIGSGVLAALGVPELAHSVATSPMMEAFNKGFPGRGMFDRASAAYSEAKALPREAAQSYAVLDDFFNPQSEHFDKETFDQLQRAAIDPASAKPAPLVRPSGPTMDEDFANQKHLPPEKRDAAVDAWRKKYDADKQAIRDAAEQADASASNASRDLMTQRADNKRAAEKTYQESQQQEAQARQDAVDLQNKVEQARIDKIKTQQVAQKQEAIAGAPETDAKLTEKISPLGEDVKRRLAASDARVPWHDITDDAGVQKAAKAAGMDVNDELQSGRHYTPSELQAKKEEWGKKANFDANKATGKSQVYRALNRAADNAIVNALPEKDAQMFKGLNNEMHKLYDQKRGVSKLVKKNKTQQSDIDSIRTVLGLTGK